MLRTFSGRRFVLTFGGVVYNKSAQTIFSNRMRGACLLCDIKALWENRYSSGDDRRIQPPLETLIYPQSLDFRCAKITLTAMKLISG